MSTPIAEKMAREPAMRELFACGHRRSLPKNKVVVEEGGRPESLYLIMTGTVAVSATRPNGQDLLLACMYPGEYFGEMGLFPDVNERSARIRTRTECLVLEVSYARFLELSGKHPELWIDVASQLAARLRAVNRRLAEMPTLHAADRIWLVLCELADRSDSPRVPEGVLLKVTRQDLGKLAGCTRELAGMVLHDFQTEGRVTLKGQTVIVRKRGASEASTSEASS